MTTKEQERKALEQIKNILSTLDANGWVCTAFEGCVRDAEENIDSDFALSMNGRWQDAEQKIEHLKAELSEAKAEAEAATMRADRYSKSLLSPEDLSTISSILQYHNQIKYLKDINESNEAILQYAETPDCDEFKTAVAKRKLSQRLSKQLDDLVVRIETARHAE